MGLFSKVKDMFDKNIDVDNSFEDELIFRIPKNYISMSYYLVVREPFNVVTVVDNKVCDIIYSGKYKITPSLIPVAYKKSGAQKLFNKGKTVNKIKCDIYYINSRMLKNLTFTSDFPFMFNKTEYGKVKGFLEGKYNLLVNDPFVFVKCLIREEPKLNSELAKYIIGLKVGNTINNLVEHSKFGFTDLLKHHDKVNEYSSFEISNAFDSMGFAVSDIEIQAVKLNKKMQSQIEKSGILPESDVVSGYSNNAYEDNGYQQSMGGYNSLNNYANNYSSNYNSFSNSDNSSYNQGSGYSGYNYSSNFGNNNENNYSYQKNCIYCGESYIGDVCPKCGRKNEY